MRLIMEIRGRGQIRLTMNTYSHILPAMQQQGADRLDAGPRRLTAYCGPLLARAWPAAADESEDAGAQAKNSAMVWLSS
jgi:hypothetical protein